MGERRQEDDNMTNNFKNAIDRQMWVMVAPAPNAHAAGSSLATDLRNDISRNPFVYQLASATVLNRYNIIKKGWNFVQSPALAGTFGAGSGVVFAPSCGLMGNIGAGCTTTSVVTTTAITSVGTNMLANRGGGTYGFRIRIKGNSAGGSGKTEERWIIGNTSGTTPTILLDSALTFTPANGDTYEIIAGRVFMLNAGTLASGSWKSFEVAANLLTTCTQTNLAATISTDFSGIALDEQYVPYDRKPGEGFKVGAGQYDGTSKYCLTATASAAGTITGQSSGGDATVLQNEYRNFQIRIVEDASIPTATGQRRIIASHTAGASPVYTLGSNWAVTPSATAKFVIELPNLILLWSSGTTTTYTYNYSGSVVNNGTNSINNDAWHTTYFEVRGGAMAAGCTTFASFGIEPDAAKNARHSYVFSFRGGGVSTIDMLDISGGTTGTWSNAIVYDGAVNLTTGSCGIYAPASDKGRFGYLNSYVASAISQIYRFDVKNRVLSPETPTDWIQAGTAAVGDRIASYVAIDGSDKYSIILLLSHTAANAQEMIIQT
jgi:hypothetical protein